MGRLAAKEAEVEALGRGATQQQILISELRLEVANAESSATSFKARYGFTLQV